MVNENRFNLVFSAIIIFILFISSFAFTESNGTTTANFLKAEAGARTAALGGACVAVADDINTIYYNPAGLVNIKSHEATFMYNQAFMDSNYGFLAYGLNLRDKGSLGVSLTYAGVSDIKETTSLYPAGSGNIFSATDIALSLSYAKNITPNISFGNSLKFIRGSIEEEKALGFAIDFGILAQVNNHLSFGLSVLNLGTKMKYIEEGNSLPLNIKAGTSLRLLNDKLLISLDVNKPIDSDVNIRTGAEYILFNNLALRAGYSSGPSDIAFWSFSWIWFRNYLI